jgi:hypothetical protein
MAGRQRASDVLEKVQAAVEGTLELIPGLGDGGAAGMPGPRTLLPANQGSGVISSIVQAGMPTELRVCELKFAGRSTNHIALRLGFPKASMQRYMDSPRFQDLYDLHEDTMMAKLDEAVQVRLQNAYIGTIDDLIEMRDGAKGFLRRQLNMDIIQLNEKYAGVGKGAPSTQLRAIHEKLSRTKDGTTTRERFTVEGDKATVAQTFANRSGGSDGNDPGGNGQGDGTHLEPDTNAGEVRVAEVEAPPALAGGHEGVGEGVAQSDSETGGEATTDL